MSFSSRTLKDVSRFSEDAYFCVDVETDGPIPGEFSLLSFACVVAGFHDGRRFQAPEKYDDGFYAELRPVSDRFEEAAMKVNGLDRSKLIRDGLNPEDALKQLSSWIWEHSGGRRPIMVASPAGFDWSFMHWYFVRYLGESPFGYSGLFDVKTALAVRFDRPVAKSGRKNVPAWLRSELPHTHNALDDAKEQARIFCNLMDWRGLTSTAAF